MFSDLEKEYLAYIKDKTIALNKDNITRTKAYQDFYQLFPEIQWSLLASVVSRNAGWNMTDLMTPSFEMLLSESTRWKLFSTYERANWLIFSDAYPQLLVFQLSETLNRPMFHLLTYFKVSQFMRNEWEHYWMCRNTLRIRTALIINEQNIIQSPVTNHPFYKKRVFFRFPYLLQDFLHMSAIILPSRTGNMFALDVHRFSQVKSRINLGKRIARVLFDKNNFSDILDFCTTVVHTGSRHDYEQFLANRSMPTSPKLRDVYPVVDHQDKIRKDWYLLGGCQRKWWKEEKTKSKNSWHSFRLKQTLLHHISNIKRKYKKA
ncbi:DUF2515 family protein [Aquibacillus salsiterrae]|uniref:DUF2515 domain-containing protein n=1 Tax=Aquibacillus salsiterrae TaxID=2950439 RepID=A0A9X3WAB3_9BACI|nr:DUF2515 family protein [Aquibacillus salsiterrae]MDC3415340.1 DUF2515 domain-containing protein [Aquibacillus salsiterrae]